MQVHLKLCENERPTVDGFYSEEMELISNIWNIKIEEK